MVGLRFRDREHEEAEVLDRTVKLVAARRRTRGAGEQHAKPMSQGTVERLCALEAQRRREATGGLTHAPLQVRSPRWKIRVEQKGEPAILKVPIHCNQSHDKTLYLKTNEDSRDTYAISI